MYVYYIYFHKSFKKYVLLKCLMFSLYLNNLFYFISTERIYIFFKYVLNELKFL